MRLTVLVTLLPALAVSDHAGDELIGIAVPFDQPLSASRSTSSSKRPWSGHAGPSHHFGIALVEQEDAAIRIEHGKSLRHVVERGVEQDFLLMEFALRAAVDHGRQQR